MKIVISLGGSIINPGKINIDFLKEFKKIIKNYNGKIVIVTGGGKVARDYIEALNFKPEKIKSLMGIKTTKLNAMLVSNFLDSNILIPDSMSEVKKLLNKNKIVVCGALGYQPDMTSDGTAAEIAKNIKADLFINMTNVSGLYTKNPKKYKNAKFIPEISFSAFLKIANKIKFKAGQHFVLDQSGAKIITKHKIKTIILKGNNNLKLLLENKNFKGTIIS